MASFKNMEIAASVASYPNIDVKHGFLGFTTKVYYHPTHAEVKCIRNYYTVESGHVLQQFLSNVKDNPRNAEKTSGLKLEANPNGNYCLEMCVSLDNQFIALQLLRFSELAYNPVSEILFYEGPEAEMLCRVLRKQIKS